ncbi:MAG: Asp/Glu racemase [Anaerolineae bacterium]|nr:Asp/Glu racemase [Anaerolineae bacterium]
MQPHRIGLMVPSSNTVLEPDFYRNLPHGWTVHTARMYLEDVTVTAEQQMLDEHTLPAARQLATAHPHVVVFGCTSASALRGNLYEERLVEDIQQVVGVPVISVSRAVRQTLKNLHARNIVVITPYLEEINAKIRRSFEEDGMNVLRLLGMGIRENARIALVPGEMIVNLAHRAVHGLSPDALFVSCTNFPAMSILDALRRAFPFPVITSNQAALDMAIKTSAM